MSATGLLIQVSQIIDNGQGQIAADAIAQLQRLRAADVRLACVDQIPQQELNDICGSLWKDAGIDPLVVVGLGEKASFIWPKPAQLLRAAAESEMDVFSSWIVAHDAQAFHAAAQAGFLGGIYIGADEDKPQDNCGLQVLNHALSLADAPRVMIPPNGGCWHDK